LNTKKTIYLIRHGQTDYNLRGIVQGSGIDSDLNETGRKQAQLFHDAYGHIGFDHVFTSQLKRTHQSVQPFLSSGTPWTILPELNEINWGVFEGKESTPEAKQAFNDVVESWRQGEVHIPIEGGESPQEMFERQQVGWHKIRQEQHEKVLICMHGRAMRSFLSLLLQTPLSDMDQYPHTNLCLYTLENFGINVELTGANITSHLTIPS